ncbi:hypothetical protein [Parapedobacter sp. 10938]|uniref:hypothetical protein n=1 Tax=Parapedobacter flavus TaxID=3110225 RepID=UPI002DB5F3CA|nr:hypothetical protein [Parapedobacter sp. 10938]MEC3880220.1 hypothetical protein [Parapedobacter sp. 10938]
MSIRKPHIHEQGLYFITFTNTHWLPLIQLTNAYDLVYNWFGHLQQQGHLIISYVIMPNHIHLLLAYHGGEKSLNTLIGNGKRFMTYEIIKRLQETHNTNILHQLQTAVNNSDIKRQKKYAVFKKSFDVLHCYSQKFILQKMNYIHANPCSKKWMLADAAIDYPHSSAKFYETGEQGIYPVTSWMDLEHLDWWK